MPDLWNVVPDDGWTRFAFDAAWQSTVIGFLAFLSLRTLVRRPANRAWVATLAVGLCLLTPLLSLAMRVSGCGLLAKTRSVSLAAPTSEKVELDTSLGHPQATTEVAGSSQVQRAVLSLRDADTIDLAADSPPSGIRSQGFARSVLAPVSRRLVPWGIFAMVWSAASIVAGVKLLSSARQLAKLCHGAEPCNDAVLIAASTAAAKRIGLARVVQLSITRGVASPAVVGFGRSQLLIPESWRAKAATDWPSIFCHELAHLRRGDGWSQLFVELVRVALPWQPLLLLLRREQRLANEEACDDWVVRSGTDPLDFAATLTAWAACPSLRLALAVVGSAADSKRRIMRLATLKSQPEPRLGRLRLCGGACCAAGIAMALALLQLGRVSMAENKTQAVADTASPEPPANANLADSDLTLGRAIDSAQWGGSPARNNARNKQRLPTTWNIGDFGEDGTWIPGTGLNIHWAARLGSLTHGTPVVAGGKVFVGTNNGGGRLDRYPPLIDLGCLLCFRVADGQFLWQHSAEKLATGRQHDWELQGVCSTPLVEEDRLWFVSNRCEVVCLDTEGFRDRENDGPYDDEPNEQDDESDVVWKLDMRQELGVSPHNMSSCSVTSAGDLLFVCTSHGVNESHNNILMPDAPSFLAMDKRSGKIVWADNSPGRNILHGQWSSPAYDVLGNVPQIIFGGGDGWLYSFRADEGHDGKPELLWKFDCNPKDARFAVAGRGTRNHIIAMPMIHDGLVYVAVGEDPEHGEGEGHLWCINPTRRGDVSSEQVFNANAGEWPVPPRRLRAAIAEDGDVVKENPNSAGVWHYAASDQDGDGRVSFEETMHRTVSTVVVDDGLLVVPDFSGLVHCLDAKTGHVHWTHDLLAATWASALVADGKVYVPDEGGKITILELSPQKKIIAVVEMGKSVYSTPVAAGGVLYIAGKDLLFAISARP